MPRMKGSEWIANAWLALGVKDVFLVPTNLYDSLVRLEGRGVRRILTHGEKAAAYMADAYAQASGRPGIVITQGGPGATNLAAGLADAYQGSVPVIAFTSTVSPAQSLRNRYQEVVAHFEDVTKYRAVVARTDRLPDMFAQAWRAATAGDPRPVVLFVLADTEAGQADLPEPRFDTRYAAFPAIRIEPEPAAVAQACDELLRAERPVMVVGGGAMKSGAWAECVQLAERLQLPVATSLSGKGAIADDHPLSVGVVGSYARRCANDVVSRADVALLVGTRAGGQSTNNWTLPRPESRVIHISIDPSEPGRNYPHTLPLAADAQTTLRRMLAYAGDQNVRRPEWLEEIEGYVQRWRRAKQPLMESSQSPIRPERICLEITRTLPDDGVVVADTGYAGAWAGALIEFSTNGRRFLRCEGSLGWALPAAIGAKAALGDRPVLCFTGDGGFWYHIAELETAVRYGLGVVFVVLNNHALAFDTHVLDFRFESKGYELAEYLDIDFAQIARTIGCDGVRVTDPNDLSDVLRRAFASGKPTVIDVVTDHEAVAPVTNFDSLGRQERRVPDEAGDTIGVAALHPLGIGS
jgi:acetolactate synthase-1/2/3 large subunit